MKASTESETKCQEALVTDIKDRFRRVREAVALMEVAVSAEAWEAVFHYAQVIGDSAQDIASRSLLRRGQ
jgi:hypothetical protein